MHFLNVYNRYEVVNVYSDQHSIYIREYEDITCGLVGVVLGIRGVHLSLNVSILRNTTTLL